MIGQASKNVTMGTSSLAPVAGGDIDGRTWSQDYDGSNSIKALMAYAKETLLAIGGNELRRLTKELEAAMESLTKVGEIFSADMSKYKQILEDANQAARRARATMSEGILIDTFSRFTTNPLKLKNTSKTQLAKIRPALDALVHPVIIAAAVEASRSRFKLE